MAPVGGLLWLGGAVDEGNELEEVDEPDEDDDWDPVSPGQHIFTTPIST
jgi:hypothetical protein